MVSEVKGRFVTFHRTEDSRRVLGAALNSHGTCLENLSFHLTKDNTKEALSSDLTTDSFQSSSTGGKVNIVGQADIPN